MSEPTPTKHGIAPWSQRFPGDTRTWYAWRRAEAQRVVKCGHAHRSEAAAKRCLERPER